MTGECIIIQKWNVRMSRMMSEYEPMEFARHQQ